VRGANFCDDLVELGEPKILFVDTPDPVLSARGRLWNDPKGEDEYKMNEDPGLSAIVVLNGEASVSSGVLVLGDLIDRVCNALSTRQGLRYFISFVRGRGVSQMGCTAFCVSGGNKFLDAGV
jgi:hypothetical protein